MHSNDWNHDSAGNITVPVTTHHVATYPNDLTGTTINLTYNGYGDSDAMVPLPDAVLVAAWSSYAADASVLAYDTNPAPEGGQIVFFCFNYAAAGPERVDLLENAVLWLLTPELGECAVSGTVTLDGMSDHSGISVRAVPAGPSTVTGTDGTYQLDGLFAGPYTIIAEKEGWSVGAVEVVTVEGQDLTGIDMVLTPVTVSEFCDSPGAPINDYQTTTCTMDVLVEPTLVISELAVFINITHTYQGDLHVTVIAPDGAEVILHGGTGGSADNIYGWYPDQLTPVGDLGAFIGHGMAGTWTLDGLRRCRRRPGHRQRVVPALHPRRGRSHRRRRRRGRASGLPLVPELSEPLQPAHQHPLRPAARGSGEPADLRSGGPPGARAGERGAAGRDAHRALGRHGRRRAPGGERRLLLPADHRRRHSPPTRWCWSSRGAEGVD